MDQQIVVPGDQPTHEEIVLRFEGSGGYTAYAVNFRTMAYEIMLAWPDITEMIPKGWRSLVEAFVFGMRHGPVQKAAKEKGLNPDDYFKAKIEDEDGVHGVDKDAAAIQLMLVTMFIGIRQSSLRKDGVLEPVDFSREDMKVAYEGIIRRLESYDAVAHVDSKSHIESKLLESDLTEPA